jgi:putative ABC transport system permease protein
VRAVAQCSVPVSRYPLVKQPPPELVRQGMDNLISDLRYALRTLVRNPGFTFVAVVSLALGIGVNVTIFSVVNAVLEKPIGGVRDPGRLVRLYRGSHSPLGYQDFQYFRDTVRSFAGLVAERMQGVAIERDGVVDALEVAVVPDNYFSTLGVSPAQGRLFGGEVASATPIIVLGFRYWQRELGADPSAIGRTIRLNDSPFTVVGVASPAFTSSVPLWNPQGFVPFSAARPILGADPSTWDGSVYATARLRESVNRSAAQAELNVKTSQLVAARPGTRDGMTVRLDDARGVIAEIRTPATVVSTFLMGIVGLVLLIACANVANLLLARATARRREIGVRLAVGASRHRIVRQLLTESLLLAAIGGAVAFLAAVQATRALALVLMANAPIDLAVSFTPDGRVLLFTIMVSFVTAALFGLAPALQSARRDLLTVLRDDADRSGYRRSRLRSGLVIAQVLLCTVLVAGSMLFLRSLGNAKAIDPGFATVGVIDIPVDLAPRGLDEALGIAFYRRLLDETRAIPGVGSATLANVVPLSGSNNQTSIWIEGREPGRGQRLAQAYFNVVGTGYLTTLGIPLVRGRDVEATDTPASEPVVVVNETMARRFWPNDDALGKRFSLTSATGPWARVVGIAKDTRYNSLGETPPPFMYLPLTQNYQSSMVVQVRVAQSAKAIGEAVSRIVKTLDPQLPAVRPVTLETDMRVALLPAKLGASLLGVFGSLALLLATVGIYGVASFAVARRTREIGIRAALGAQRADVLRLVVGESMRRVVIGLIAGLVGALGLARVVASQLYGVGAVDPITFIATPLILGTVALLASWVPARRAARVDPLVALRAE